MSEYYSLRYVAHCTAGVANPRRSTMFVFRVMLVHFVGGLAK
jgi:hypothetical protein